MKTKSGVIQPPIPSPVTTMGEGETTTPPIQPTTSIEMTTALQATTTVHPGNTEEHTFRLKAITNIITSNNNRKMGNNKN